MAKSPPLTQSTQPPLNAGFNHAALKRGKRIGEIDNVLYDRALLGSVYAYDRTNYPEPMGGDIFPEWVLLGRPDLEGFKTDIYTRAEVGQIYARPEIRERLAEKGLAEHDVLTGILTGTFVPPYEDLQFLHQSFTPELDDLKAPELHGEIAYLLKQDYLGPVFMAGTDTVVDFKQYDAEKIKGMLDNNQLHMTDAHYGRIEEWMMPGAFNRLRDIEMNSTYGSIWDLENLPEYMMVEGKKIPLTLDEIKYRLVLNDNFQRSSFQEDFGVPHDFTRSYAETIALMDAAQIAKLEIEMEEYVHENGCGTASIMDIMKPYQYDHNRDFYVQNTMNSQQDMDPKTAPEVNANVTPGSVFRT